MTPDQFITRLAKNGPDPAYLFLGPEGFERDRCRKALLDAVVPGEEREGGYTRYDLDQVSLAEAVDDARALSLFASRRVIWLGSAEAATPRGKSTASDSEDDEPGVVTDALGDYLKSPTPDVTIVVDASRFDFEGEDKAKLERVAKFYAAIPQVVEFRPYSPESARGLAQKLAKEKGLQLGLAELAQLLEATAGDASRIALEVEKLSLLTAGQRKVTPEDIRSIVPDSQSSTIFALVAALGRGDRKRALEILDTLTREGEYMPLALTFLATQFRMALVAREANLRGASAIQAYFTKMGLRIWAERARQIEQTVEAFPKAKLEKAVAKLFEADRDLRDARPDDRVVMESLILDLTSR